MDISLCEPKKINSTYNFADKMQLYINVLACQYNQMQILSSLDSATLYCVVVPSDKGAFGSSLSIKNFISFNCRYPKIKKIGLVEFENIKQWRIRMKNGY